MIKICKVLKKKDCIPKQMIVVSPKKRRDHTKTTLLWPRLLLKITQYNTKKTNSKKYPQLTFLKLYVASTKKKKEICVKKHEIHQQSPLSEQNYVVLSHFFSSAANT